MINGSTFGLEGTEKLKQILVTDHWAYLPDTIQEGNAIQSFMI
jgi:UDPglucose 6-dehydrogenase